MTGVARSTNFNVGFDFQMKIDFQRISLQVLQFLRGTRSQRSLSRRFGFRFNQVSRWESGRTSIRWDEFCEFCRFCKADLPSALKKVNMRCAPEKIVEVLNFLFPDMNATDFSARTGFSRQVASRWLSGKVVPTLAEVLELIHIGTGHIQDFLGALLTSEQIDQLNPDWKYLRSIETYIKQYPLLLPVQMCFVLEEYCNYPEHIRGFVARKLGISVAEEEFHINLLKKIGLIEIKNARYVPVSQKLMLAPLESDDEWRANRKFWLTKSMQCLENIEPRGRDAFFGYHCFPASESFAKELQKKWIEFFHLEFSAIYDRSVNEKPDTMYLLNFAFCPMNTKRSR